MDRHPKGTLRFGEWKSISTDRVVLAPGPSQAVATVKLAYDLYTKRGKDRYQIAEILNKARKLRGRTAWTIVMLRDLFIDPIYKGSYAYGKHEVRPGASRRVPPDRWLVCEHAFPGIISEKQWNQARERIREEIRPLVDSEMLDDLRHLWKRKGQLNTNLINADKGMPSAVVYRKHFGALNEAYRLIGYPIPKPYTYINVINLSRQLGKKVSDEICAAVILVGGTAQKLPEPNLLLLNEGVTVHVSICRGRARPKLSTVWTMLVQQPVTADVAIIVRMKPPATSVLDYFVFPAAAQMRGAWHAREKDNDALLELYRLDSLESFFECFRRFTHRGPS